LPKNGMQQSLLASSSCINIHFEMAKNSCWLENEGKGQQRRQCIFLDIFIHQFGI
jgi:hypothetical protein